MDTVISGQEIWKKIEGLDSYMASNHGRIKSLPRSVRSFVGNGGYKITNERILNDYDNSRGYRYITISINGRRKNHYIHRLVANTFISNPKGFDQVNHIDGNKSNNSVSNLEWVTERQNRDHAVKTDLMKFGEDAPNNKLTEEQVIEILAIASKNPKVNRLRLSKKYNVADTCICRIISGKRWRRTYEKFHSKEATEK